ncbi:ABC transporter permease [Micromonospora sp. NPDC049114]|uniref:ABC transporter permease n=1 Tax=unclassified Micromonospora TaxID=2617518 RepID=UPI001F3FC730|nr:ABC transporter permease [Micromonospora sp. MH99]MCF0092980.1 Daunorubicin/doxorubicin resistance ABC transporter permease protein DrrB [Micromonospora sp. MH99]
MSTLNLALRDSNTMLRRNLLHMRRYPSLTLMLIGLPVILLLLFVYVFGGTLGAGLGPLGGRADYANYVTPGILLITVASAAQGTAISVAMDMAEGIIARFRTMAIFRPSVLTGHVVGSVLQTMLSLAAVTGVALLVGFRPTAGAVEWLAAIGVLTMITFAVTWLTVALGLATKSVEAASNVPMPLMLLPFLGSGFVPTDSMPTAVRLFADYQPFTPVMETLRGLLLGSGIGSNGILAVAWCAVITVASFLWAKALYNRGRTA